MLTLRRSRRLSDMKTLFSPPSQTLCLIRSKRSHLRSLSELAHLGFSTSAKTFTAFSVFRSNFILWHHLAELWAIAGLKTEIMEERNIARCRPICTLQHMKQRETIKRLVARMQIRRRRRDYEILHFHANRWRMFIAIQFFTVAGVFPWSEFRRRPHELVICWIHDPLTADRIQRQNPERRWPPAVAAVLETQRAEQVVVRVLWRLLYSFSSCSIILHQERRSNDLHCSHWLAAFSSFWFFFLFTQEVVETAKW